MGQRYTDEELMEILRKKAKELGRPPRKREVKQCLTIASRFGSWEQGLIRAGVKEKSAPRLSYAKQKAHRNEKAQELIDQTIEHLTLYSQQHGFPTTAAWSIYARAHQLHSYQKLKSHFQMTWEEIARHLGFDVRERHYTKEECEEAFRLAAEELGAAFSKRQYDVWAEKNGFPRLGVALRRMNMTFNQAKQALGLLVNDVPKHSITYTHEELKQALKDCYDHYQRKFSEDEYESWRRKQSKPYPAIDTIRQRLRSIPEVKQSLEIPTYVKGPAYQPDDYRQHLFRFIRHQLRVEEYEKWAKENKAMGRSALLRQASSFDHALIQVLTDYIRYLSNE